MTPDESLQALRAALSVLIPRRDSLLAIMRDDYKRDELDELIDAAASLDVWLSKGGWLPAAWERRTEADPFPSSLIGSQAPAPVITSHVNEFGQRMTIIDYTPNYGKSR